MRIPGDNVGSLSHRQPGRDMPSYLDRVQFVSLDVSYLAIQGPLTSGFFAGIGGYGIRPEEVSPELDPYRDQRERVIGLRVGVDGDLHIYRGLSLVGRLTFHAILHGHEPVPPRDDRGSDLPVLRDRASAREESVSEMSSGAFRAVRPRGSRSLEGRDPLLRSG